MTTLDRVRQGMRENIIRSNFHDPEMRELGKCQGLSLAVARQHAERLVKAAEDVKAAKEKKGEALETIPREILKDAEAARFILLSLDQAGITDS